MSDENTYTPPEEEAPGTIEAPPLVSGTAPVVVLVDGAGTIARDMTPEEIEALVPVTFVQALRSITPRQIRLQLLNLGITAAMVDAAIAAIPDATDRARAEIEWTYAVSYDRSDPLVYQIGTAFSLTPSEIDAAWAVAMTL